MTNPIRLSGFEFGPELSIVIDRLISALPSKSDIKSYNEYLSSEKLDTEQDVNTSTPFVNPFSPTEETGLTDKGEFVEHSEIDVIEEENEEVSEDDMDIELPDFLEFDELTEFEINLPEIVM